MFLLQYLLTGALALMGVLNSFIQSSVILYNSAAFELSFELPVLAYFIIRETSVSDVSKPTDIFSNSANTDQCTWGIPGLLSLRPVSLPPSVISRGSRELAAYRPEGTGLSSTHSSGKKASTPCDPREDEAALDLSLLPIDFALKKKKYCTRKTWGKEELVFFLNIYLAILEAVSVLFVIYLVDQAIKFRDFNLEIDISELFPMPTQTESNDESDSVTLETTSPIKRLSISASIPSDEHVVNQTDSFDVSSTADWTLVEPILVATLMLKPKDEAPDVSPAQVPVNATVMPSLVPQEDAAILDITEVPATTEDATTPGTPEEPDVQDPIDDVPAQGPGEDAPAHGPVEDLEPHLMVAVPSNSSIASSATYSDMSICSLPSCTGINIQNVVSPSTSTLSTTSSIDFNREFEPAHHALSAASSSASLISNGSNMSTCSVLYCMICMVEISPKSEMSLCSHLSNSNFNTVLAPQPVLKTLDSLLNLDEEEIHDEEDAGEQESVAEELFPAISPARSKASISSEMETSSVIVGPIQLWRMGLTTAVSANTTEEPLVELPEFTEEQTQVHIQPGEVVLEAIDESSTSDNTEDQTFADLSEDDIFELGCAFLDKQVPASPAEAVLPSSFYTTYVCTEFDLPDDEREDDDVEKLESLTPSNFVTRVAESSSPPTLELTDAILTTEDSLFCLASSDSVNFEKSKDLHTLSMKEAKVQSVKVMRALRFKNSSKEKDLMDTTMPFSMSIGPSDDTLPLEDQGFNGKTIFDEKPLLFSRTFEGLSFRSLSGSTTGPSICVTPVVVDDKVPSLDFTKDLPTNGNKNLLDTSVLSTSSTDPNNSLPLEDMGFNAKTLNNEKPPPSSKTFDDLSFRTLAGSSTLATSMNVEPLPEPKQ